MPLTKIALLDSHVRHAVQHHQNHIELDVSQYQYTRPQHDRLHSYPSRVERFRYMGLVN